MDQQKDMWLKVRTKGNANPQGKARVYFTCHPLDFDLYFDNICEQIFRTQDCAIYYTEDMSMTYSDDDMETDLRQMTLFVIPVTLKLLQGGNRAVETDPAFANENHIPVLPLMMGSGLVDLFTKRFGKLQYLNPNSMDETAIRYEEKLKSFLENVLVGSELRRRVQDAFDACIFLSYRKKDRKYANELMRLIHKDPKYRDIAIWYDEYLTPGEAYTENIEAAMRRSELFTLLVTPNLLEDPNYVMTTEYPAALDQKKQILPVEMSETAHAKMEEKYRDLPAIVRGCDDAVFYDRLQEELQEIAKEAKDKDPNHYYLIGLAYLEGIDVEKDTGRAVEMITMAAEAGLPEAMQKLAVMYHEGLGVERNWEEWVKWRERDAAAAEEEYGEEDEIVIRKKANLLYTYAEMGRYSEVIDQGIKVYETTKKVMGDTEPGTLKILNSIAVAYGGLGDYETELEILQMVQEMYEMEKDISGDDPDRGCTLNNMACTCMKMGDTERALEYAERSYEIRKEVLGEEHPETLITRYNIAMMRGVSEGPEKKLELLEEVYELQKKNLGEDDPDLLTTLSSIAYSYYEMKDYEKSLKLSEKVYESKKNVLGEEHPDTVDELHKMANMIDAYRALGGNEKASELIGRLERLRSNS